MSSILLLYCLQSARTTRWSSMTYGQRIESSLFPRVRVWWVFRQNESRSTKIHKHCWSSTFPSLLTSIYYHYEQKSGCFNPEDSSAGRDNQITDSMRMRRCRDAALRQPLIPRKATSLHQHPMLVPVASSIHLSFRHLGAGG